MCLCLCLHVCFCICVCICLYVCLCIWVCMCVCRKYLRVCICVMYMCVYECIFMSRSVFVCMCLCVFLHGHAHAYGSRGQFWVLLPRIHSSFFLSVLKTGFLIGLRLMIWIWIGWLPSQLQGSDYSCAPEHVASLCGFWASA